MWLDGSNLLLYQVVELGQNSMQLIVELGCIFFLILSKVVQRSVKGRLVPVCREEGGAR